MERGKIIERKGKMKRLIKLEYEASDKVLDYIGE